MGRYTFTLRWLHNRVADLAIGYARTVFLRIEHKVSQANEDTLDEVFAWAEQHHYVCGLSFLESVSTTIGSFGGSDDQRAAAVTQAASAYRDEMDRLFLTTGHQEGGAA